MKKIKAIATEVYSRVVGYYRPVNSWNVGKQQEFKDRVMVRTGNTKDDNQKVIKK